MSRASIFVSALFFGLGLLAIGCASTAAPDGAPADADAGEKPCGPPPGKWEEGVDPPAHCVRHVTGSIASGGAPIAAVNMTVCGRACFGGQTDEAGAFRIRVGAHLPDGQYTLFVHGRPRHASLFLPLPAAPPEQIDFEPIDVPALSADGVMLPPDDGDATTVRIGPIEIGIAAKTSWDLAFEDAVDDIDGRMLRFAEVTPERAPAFADGAALVFALAPFEAKPSLPVSLRLHETGGLAAGTSVEVVVMDAFDTEGENRSGRARPVAKGHVSADGARIETDPGEGVPLLTWIAVRAVP